MSACADVSASAGGRGSRQGKHVVVQGEGAECAINFWICAYVARARMYMNAYGIPHETGAHAARLRAQKALPTPSPATSSLRQRQCPCASRCTAPVPSGPRPNSTNNSQRAVPHSLLKVIISVTHAPCLTYHHLPCHTRNACLCLSLSSPPNHPLTYSDLFGTYTSNESSCQQPITSLYALQITNASH